MTTADDAGFHGGVNQFERRKSLSAMVVVSARSEIWLLPGR